LANSNWWNWPILIAKFIFVTISAKICIRSLHKHVAILKKNKILKIILWNYAYCKRQKFRGWKVLQIAGFIRYVGKVSWFFPSPPSWFPTLQNSYEGFNENFTFLRWILLNTVITVLGNGREYITDTCVCRFHAFQDDHAVTGVEELEQELQWKWVRDEIDTRVYRFLVSFFCKLLTNLFAETLWILRHYCGIFPRNLFMVSTFRGAKV